MSAVPCGQFEDPAKEINDKPQGSGVEVVVALWHPCIAQFALY